MSRSRDTAHEDEYAPRMEPGARMNPTPRVMDADLKPWALYSLVGADEPESLEEMKRYFIRYRATKSRVMSHAFTHDALQRSWCAFIGAEEIPFLGCFIGKRGLRADPAKVNAIADWPVPSNQKDL